jgi:hypothetical protein
MHGACISMSQPASKTQVSTQANAKIMRKWVDASYSGSKTTRVIVLKVHINGKINTRMEKMLKINV